MLNNLEFTAFCKKALKENTWYMWGDYGRLLTADTIKAKANQYPSHYPKSYQDELIAQIEKKGIGCDCTGLIKWFLWTNGDISTKPKYQSATDKAASGWYKAASVKGDISTLPEQPGLILWLSGHCGVYVGDGDVIECTKSQFGNGVVTTKVSDRKWVTWCECPYIEYMQNKDTHFDPKMITAKVKQNCPTYATINQRLQIGTVYECDAISYLGDIGDLALIIYPTTATKKVAFVDRNLIEIVKE